MKIFFKKFAAVVGIAVALAPAVVFAHQPRVVTSRVTAVSEPEVSKAYYGQLTGQPDVYTFTATAPFDLYVNVLVPNSPGQQKDVSALVLKDGTAVANLQAEGFAWKSYHEPFGNDNYFMGPEYKARAEAGHYEVRVSSPGNTSKYSLAIGETEAFNFTESYHAVRTIPQLKKTFFNVSPATFIFSPFGIGFVLIMFALAFAFGFAYRWLVRKFVKAKPGTRPVSKNINTRDRLLRAGIGLALLLLAIFTTWHPLLLFASGFCFFEALFSWCLFNQLTGKNSCPL